MSGPDKPGGGSDCSKLRFVPLFCLTAPGGVTGQWVLAPLTLNSQLPQCSNCYLQGNRHCLSTTIQRYVCLNLWGEKKQLNLREILYICHQPRTD